MRQILLIILFFSVPLIAFSNNPDVSTQEKKYNIFLQIEPNPKTTSFNSYIMRYSIEAILSTKKFHFTVRPPTLAVDLKQKVPLFEINVVLDKKDDGLFSINYTLFRYPKKGAINIVSEDDVSQAKLNLKLREMVYKLLYGSSHSSSKKKLIPLFLPVDPKINTKTPPIKPNEIPKNSDPELNKEDDKNKDQKEDPSKKKRKKREKRTKKVIK